MKHKGCRDGKGVGRIAESVRQDVSLLLWKPPPCFQWELSGTASCQQIYFGSSERAAFCIMVVGEQNKNGVQIQVAVGHQTPWESWGEVFEPS